MKLEARTYADTVVVAPTGRLDHDNCEAFRAGLKPHIQAAAATRQRIVLDLSGLEYVSSAGLRCFMLAAKEIGSHGGKIVLASLRPVVAEIFQISRFDMVFEVFPSVREALATLSPSASAAYGQD